MQSQPRDLSCKPHFNYAKARNPEVDYLKPPWLPARREGNSREPYHQHLMKVLFKFIDVGVGLQALCICPHTSQHELIILLHQEATFKDLFALTD